MRLTRSSVLRVKDAKGGRAHAAARLLVESDERQQNMKCRALGEFAFHFDLPGMFLDNAVHHGEAEPRAVILGREKGIEDMWNVFVADALAVVANGDAQNLVHISVRAGDGRHPFLGRPNFRRNHHFTAALHCVHGVKEKVEEDLFELVRIGADCIHIRLPGTSQFDFFLIKPMPDQLERFFQDGVDVHRLEEQASPVAQSAGAG